MPFYNNFSQTCLSKSWWPENEHIIAAVEKYGGDTVHDDAIF